MAQNLEVDYQALFECGQPLYLILIPDAPKYTIVGASDAYLHATRRTREELTGRGIFEAFPENPDDLEAKSESSILGSIERAIATGFPDSLPFLKYDVPRPESEGGGYEVKYWSVSHAPIFDRKGKLVNVAQKCEDVTEFVVLQQKGAETTTMNEELRKQVGQLELATMARAQEIKDANTKLVGANLALNKQKAEVQELYEKLKELDQVKTQFFANISHEFRTPLTLMLAPLEDILAGARGELLPNLRNDIELIHRNTARLLKLVNALLDFSKLEASRTQASFRRVDISRLTRELASSFTSLIEGVRINYSVDAAKISEPVYVDQEMWEKIVLNLISNAFKFTMKGEIVVELRSLGDKIEFSVKDTGCGIAEKELPRMFERFHRVEGAKGRSFEGTGIGLSLVNEFSKLHGGSVRVVSKEGEGSKFIVSIPTGTAHLPVGFDIEKSNEPDTRGISPSASSFLLEASRWSKNVEFPVREEGLGNITPTQFNKTLKAAEHGFHILIVDDSADMRDYLTRTLSEQWEVEVATDGEMALDLIRERLPDLVLSDVMMPRLDGIGLLQRLRGSQRTAEIPVILLSARAGEEALLEGIETGADDYIVKPFSRRELLARIHTHLNMSAIRHKLLVELELVNKELEAFSYSVSHDLRAPLRAIDGFSKMLLEKHGQKLSDEGQHYLNRIRSGSQKMSQLIDDLLELSRLSRLPLRKQTVNISEISKKIVGELKAADPTRQIEVSVAQELEVDADRGLIEVLLTNLLGNSWKFTGKQQKARIVVGEKVIDEEKVLFVEDNGAGFDMAYAQKLFVPFQRLHEQEQFPGTGIGLATVHRVVTRHGGKIWADGEVGKGATFYFTLGGK